MVGRSQHRTNTMLCSALLGVLLTVCMQPPENPVSELESSVSADLEAKVTLEFRDQEWLPALQWLATQLEMNLDWQELPTDKFSLSSTQELTLKEAEDLFNMQLLARGFATVKRAGVLRVVSLKELDVTLVPRIEPADLDSLAKHSLVRVSFPLEWMIAEEAAKELQPLLSPYGKLFPMSSANRLEAVDAVVNLREFQRLLNNAENDETRRERVAEFRLQHRKAEEVAPKIRQLLGLPNDTNNSSAGQNQLDIEQARFRAEAVKQMGRDATALITDKKPSIFLVVNEKENSLLVNAPPNKIEIVRQAVLAMDKELPERGSTWETISRVKVYDVSGFDPAIVTKIILSLQERDSIGKDATVQHESAYNRLIAFASPEDHLTISQVIESFRADKRTAMVLQLATLDATYASKAILLVLKTAERPPNAPGVPSDGKFQVEPDPEHQRLLLWATQKEYKDVREFLAQLGESYSEAVMQSNVQIIEMHGQDVGPVVDRLQRVWGEVSDAPLLIDSDESAAVETNQPVRRDANASSNSLGQILNVPEVQFASETRTGRMIALRDLQGKTVEAGQEATDAPPVRLMEASDGNLVILSRDARAAEIAKRLLKQMISSPAQLKIITLKHSQSAVVKQQLDLIVPQSNPVINSKLSSTPSVFIDVDQRTNRLIIHNASESQLELIDETVQLLDLPDPEAEKLEREKLTYRFKHRKATVVAEALRSVYEDLMDISDRRMSRSLAFNRNIAASASSPEYQNLLSIGVDQEANLLLISAPKYLAQDVLKMAESMDTPTDGDSIAIIPFQTQVNGSDSKDQQMQESLRRILSGQSGGRRR